jgi:hypothetical protein
MVCGSLSPPGHRKYVTDTASCHLAVRVIAHFSFYEPYAGNSDETFNWRECDEVATENRIFSGRCSSRHNALWYCCLNGSLCQRRSLSPLPRIAQEYFTRLRWTRRVALMKEDMTESNYLGDLHVGMILKCTLRPLRTIPVSSGLAQGERHDSFRAVLIGRNLGQQERAQMQNHSHTNNTDR